MKNNLLALLFLSLILAGCSAGQSAHNLKGSQETEGTVQFRIGEKIAFQDHLIVSVQNLTIIHESYLDVIIVEVLVENLGDDMPELIRIPHTIVDDRGFSSQSELIEARDYSEQLYSGLAPPKGRSRGDIIFKVKKGYSNLTLIFNVEIFESPISILLL